ncbi:MAG: hypothetical protein ACYC7D_14125 [Nitrososphaerales archaeon]
MKIVADTDILSIFAKISRVDILESLFQDILIPRGVISELQKGSNMIDTAFSKAVFAREELNLLRGKYPNLHRGEIECFVVAKSRDIPMTSNERIIQVLCRREKVECLSLPNILRFAILEKVLTREEAREIVSLIELKDNTIIRNSREISK